MIHILVTGGNGQLATCIRDVSQDYKELVFDFVTVDQLDITNAAAVESYFNDNNFEYCINCAAYTAVDRAESDIETAEKINVTGVENLAKSCKENNMVLIHISTDFVFDGTQTNHYSENDQAKPISVYGLTKLQGENAIVTTLKEHVIFRTSWLYSEHGNNFVKTMIKLGSELDSISVVADQIGTPTYAVDLAKVIVGYISNKQVDYGIFHYSNEGVASWYDFAKAIFDYSAIDIKLCPIQTIAYPTPAKRPKFSVMNKSKIKSVMKLEIPHWRDSLIQCLSKI